MGRQSLFSVTTTGAELQAHSVKEQEVLTSRRATLIPWRGQLFFTKTNQLGDRLPSEWEKAVTDDGTPYYVNHTTRQTQWTDPRLELCLRELNCHDDIRLAVYRTASKMRDFQVYCRMSRVHLSDVLNAFYALDYTAHTTRGQPESLRADEIATVLLEVFSKLQNPLKHVEIMVSWLLHTFDKERTGRVPLLSIKIALSTLCSSWIEEKYRYAFGLLDSNADGMITREQLAFYLQATIQMLKPIREAWPFGPSPKHIQQAADDCCQLERERSGVPDALLISLETFVEWCMQEPRPLVWIATFHRVAATENVKHESMCAVCKMYPIIGFRYRSLTCIDKDVCQECYWTGQEGNGHKNSHQVREYCFPTTTKEDVNDFGTRLKKKLSRAFKRKKRKGTEPTATGFPPMEKVLVTSKSRSTQAATKVQDATTTQAGASTAEAFMGEGAGAETETEDELIQNMAARLQRGGADDQATSTMVVTLESEQKLHLLRVIDELDSENRDLLRQVMELQDMQGGYRDEPSSTGPSPLQDELERRVGTLTERNRDLLDQLNRLQAYHAVTGMHDAHRPISTDVSGSEALAFSKEDLQGEAARPASAESDIDLDEISEYLSQEEGSDEQQLFEMAAAIEAAFAGLRAADFDTLVQRHRDPLLTQLLRHAQALRDGLEYAVVDTKDQFGSQPAEVRMRPKLPKLNAEQRRSVWGNRVEILEEQEQYHNAPMPRESVHRHSRIVRRGRARLTAQLQRLSVYTADQSFLYGESVSGGSKEGAQQEGVVHLSQAPPPVAAEKSAAPGATGVVFQSTQARQQQVFSASTAAHTEARLGSGGSSSSTDASKTRMLSTADEPVMGKPASPPPPPPPEATSPGGRSGATRVFRAGVQGQGSSQSSPASSPKPLSPRGAGTSDGGKGDSTDTVLGTMVFGKPVEAPAGARREQMGSTHGAGGSAASATGKGAAGRKQAVHAAEVVSGPGKRGDVEREVQGAPGVTMEQPADVRDEELRETVRRVHDVPHQLPRKLSVERLKHAEHVFTDRLRRAKDTFEDTVGIPLFNVQDDNIHHTLLHHFADGHLFCVLANIKLRARNRPTIKPYCAHGYQRLAASKVIENFKSLTKSCQALGMRPGSVPSSYDFQGLQAELEHPVADRVKHNKILGALETLLSMSESKPAQADI